MTKFVTQVRILVKIYPSLANSVIHEFGKTWADEQKDNIMIKDNSEV